MSSESLIPSDAPDAVIARLHERIEFLLATEGELRAKLRTLADRETLFDDMVTAKSAAEALEAEIVALKSTIDREQRARLTAEFALKKADARVVELAKVLDQQGLAGKLELLRSTLDRQAEEHRALSEAYDALQATNDLLEQQIFLVADGNRRETALLEGLLRPFKFKARLRTL